MKNLALKANEISSTRIFTLLLALLFLTVSANAQNTNVGSTPLGIAPGSPSGSYPLSDFESVNLYNGGLNFRLPLLQIGGRGGAGYPITLHLEQKWTVTKHLEPGVGTFYWAEPGWWSEEGGGWRTLDTGRVHIRRGGSSTYYFSCGGYVNNVSLSRITFSAPDGTEYELRDAPTGGQPKVPQPCSTGFNRGRTFVTADGTTATFISDFDIIDPYWHADDETTIPPAAGYLMLRDGTRFRVENGTIKWMRDRNGNKVEFTHDVYKRVVSIKDSLNRLVTIDYSSGTTITFKGAGGTTRTIRIGSTTLANALRSGYTLQTASQLFPELHGTSYAHNPEVISYVELPDGRRYDLQYNSYAELARVVLPTGGAIEYDYAAGLTDGAASGVFNIPLNKAIYRRVVERRVYPDGASGSGYASRMTFSRPESLSANAGYVISDQYNASGTLLGRSQHYFYGSPRTSFSQKPTEYPAWQDSREYQTDVFDTNGSTILRRVNNTFAQRAAVSWWTGTAETAPPNDPRLIETTTTIEPGGANRIAKQTFGFDDAVPYNNQNNVKEYDFGTGAAGALLRETRTTFLTDSNYTNTDVHLRSLGTQVSAFDGSGVERARSTSEYDNYSGATHHAALVARTNVSGADTGFGTGYLTRGNATGSTRYLLTNGSVTGSVSSYAKYDVVGNVLESIDARGNSTYFEFIDRFGSADGEARAQGGSAELGSQSSFALATKVTNAVGHVTYTQFDFYSGKPVDAEDANGIISSGYYVDALGRPTKVISAVGTASANQTTFVYDDPNRTITSTSDKTSYNDNALKSESVYDKMGRTIESRQYEGGSNYIVTKQEYDVLGRAYKSSNPYRPWQSESAVWTTTNYDALGRVISVTTPDNAVVSTSYAGDSVTVTDPAGKARKSRSDALGRLIEVYENPAGLNYLTSYAYDVLDNLRTVSQGGQTRTFDYDSLKRLSSATNPESGTISYSYDENSNLRFKTDARGIVTENRYDVLNRVTTILYRINGQPDPNTGDVEYLYDNAQNGKGRLWLTYKWGAKTFHSVVGRYDEMGRITTYHNLFGNGQGGWHPSYDVDRTYNLAGHVISQTYPSGRTVTYGYDSAGRTTSFSGNLGDSTSRTYATGITYSPLGGIRTEQFGTDTALYHKLQYNIRGQLWDVRLSTVNDELNWNRGAIVNHYSFPYGTGTSGPDNNGNLLMQQHWVPNDDGYSLMQQNYDYDSLNRLISIGEYANGATLSGSQNFGYDRWGNRTITGATGTGINNKQFTVNPANNRLGVPSGQSGTMSYDAAGNLTTDTYSGAGVTRAYDADNRMVSETQTAGFVAGAYSYNAAGQRVRRKVDATEIWQVYGIDGELLAEYAEAGAVTSPQKEYGYRNGELLVTAEPNAGNNVVQWLVGDQLGTPRMIADKTGSLAGIKRHDYLPFGEELYAGTGNRTTGMGYSADSVRQKFTSHERDNETGLDYMQARYFNSSAGRFISPDSVGGSRLNPQSLNLYTYVINNPVNHNDPSGHMANPINPIGCILGFENAMAPMLAQDPTKTTPRVPSGYETLPDGTLAKKGGGAVIEESVTVSAKRGFFKRVLGRLGRVLGFAGGRVGGAAGHIVAEMIDPQPVGGGDADLGISSHPWLTPGIQLTFSNGRFYAHRLEQETIFFRYFGPTPMIGGGVGYFSTQQFSTAEEARRMLALSPTVTNNTAQTVVDVTVPAGTIVLIGQAAPQSPRNKYPGGGSQVVVENPKNPAMRYGTPRRLP